MDWLNREVQLSEQHRRQPAHDAFPFKKWKAFSEQIAVGVNCILVDFNSLT